MAPANLRLPGRRRPVSAARIAALLAALTAVTTDGVRAQTSVEPGGGVDVQLFRPAKDAYGLFGTETGDVNAHLRANVALVFNWAYQPLSVVFTGNRTSAGEIIANRIDTNLIAALGLFDHFELGLDIPFVMFQNGLTTDQVRVGTGGTSLQAYAMGDIHLTPKGRFLRIGDGLLSMALATTILLPTGDHRNFTGEAGFGLLPFLAVSSNLGFFRTAVDLGYRFRSKDATILTFNAGDELFYKAGAGFTFGDETSYYEISGEIWGTTGLENPFGLTNRAGAESQNPMEFLAGLRHIRALDFGEVNFHGGVGMGMLPGYGAPKVRLVIGAGYYMGEQIADQDLDGIADDNDKCTSEPEDVDFFEDENGCPDSDNDNDRVIDEDDQCPSVPEDKDDFQDSDGCPDLDNDFDGIPDGKDSCPNQPEDRDGHKDDDGCPEPDNDSDGIYDEEDACPDKAEDKDSFKDEDGCPEPDNDEDSLDDLGDVCPLAPEDKDGFEDDDGCPEPDNDKDGLLDGVDKCPNEAEVVNGVDDSDGCPDAGKTLVKITKEKIEITDKVQFKTGSAQILPASFNLLDQIAAVLANHSEIVKMRIEGHTDNAGNRKKNMQLSQQRAESVMKYLIKKGVAAERLEAKGFGPDKAIASNKTPKGKEINRRVEFMIVEQKDIVQLLEVSGGQASPTAAPTDAAGTSAAPATTPAAAPAAAPPVAPASTEPSATTAPPADTQPAAQPAPTKKKDKGKAKPKGKKKEGGDMDIGEITF